MTVSKLIVGTAKGEVLEKLQIEAGTVALNAISDVGSIRGDLGVEWGDGDSFACFARARLDNFAGARLAVRSARRREDGDDEIAEKTRRARIVVVVVAVAFIIDIVAAAAIANLFPGVVELIGEW